jgi:hypothetical protein
LVKIEQRVAMEENEDETDSVPVTRDDLDRAVQKIEQIVTERRKKKKTKQAVS